MRQDTSEFPTDGELNVTKKYNFVEDTLFHG